MIRLHVTLNVLDPANIETVAGLIKQHAALSRAEPGCARFDLYQSKDNPANVYIVEDWESPEAIDAHREAEGFTTIYQPKVVPLVDRNVEEVVQLS